MVNRQPAEWESHSACWLAWPAHEYAWGDGLAGAQRELAGLARAIVEQGEEPVELLVADETADSLARATLGDSVRRHRIAYGDVWMRDTAPIFIDHDNAVLFRFNGWGGKYVYPNDDSVGDEIASAQNISLRAFDPVLEGGALESDGAGTVITTESCLLNDNRNPNSSREELERVLEEAVGARNVIWLRGGLVGDHTDGHVDNVARFVAPGVIAHGLPSGPDDPNRDMLEDNATRLAASSDASGRRPRLVGVPSPGIIEGDEGPMAASYLNFYIANRAVLVPAFGVSQDEPARQVLAECFVDRQVISLCAAALLTGGGTLHCVTQPRP